MKPPTQRDQWAEHLRDEAVELQSQQRAAGSTHSPAERPVPHTASDVDAAVRDERARCAAIADALGSERGLQQAFAQFGPGERLAAARVARAIGQAIRSGIAPPLEP